MNTLPQRNEPSDEPDEVQTASGERQNLADALAHERNVLRTMIDLIPAMIYAKDAQSRFTACNELVARRMGASPAELLGKTDFDFFPREMAERFELGHAAAPFQRCISCNGRTVPIGKAAIIDQLQSKTRRYFEAFWQCQTCGRIYWQGSHVARMQAVLDRVFGVDRTDVVEKSALD